MYNLELWQRRISQLAYSLLFLTTVFGLVACSEESVNSEGQPPTVSEQVATEAFQVEVEDAVVQPTIARFRMATIGAPDLAAIEAAYTSALGYSVVERGLIPQSLAASWGTPNMAGRDYILLQPASGVDVYIRAVTITAQPDYVPLSTIGWNAFEIIVDDIDAVYEQLKDSSFEVIGPPMSLGDPIASIFAMQARGPAGEILYFNCETGDRSKSNLPIPGSLVDRVNIAIVAGLDAVEVSDFYSEMLHMQKAGGYDLPVSVLADALSLPSDTLFHLEMVTALEGGNLLEIDDYPDTTKSRTRAEGELPPGNAMISFLAKDISVLKADFIEEPQPQKGLAYGGKKSATTIGIAGELIEVIEE